jgi:hypothetical protein
MSSRDLHQERAHLEAWQVAFLLQRHEWLADADVVTADVVSDRLRLQRRRVSRRGTKALLPDELPVTRVGPYVKVSAGGLRRFVADDELVSLLLDAICEGRLPCPRAPTSTAPVPSLIDGLRLLAAEVSR